MRLKAFGKCGPVRFVSLATSTDQTGRGPAGGAIVCRPCLIDYGIIGVAIAMLLVAPTVKASAQSGDHGDGHGQYHDWYKDLKTPQGYSCCNGNEHGGDCRPTQARSRSDGEWEAFFGGRWHPVPAERILPDYLNQVPLRAHICEQDGYVRCFLKGGPGS